MILFFDIVDMSGLNYYRSRFPSSSSSYSPPTTTLRNRQRVQTTRRRPNWASSTSIGRLRPGQVPGLYEFISAAAAGNVQKMQTIIRKFSSFPVSSYIHGKSTGGDTALITAASNGQLGAVQFLLSVGGVEGTRDTSRSFGGETALHRAARNGHYDVVEALLVANANPDATTGGTGFTPVDYAYCNGHYDIVDLLLDYNGSDPDEYKCRRLQGRRGGYTRKQRRSCRKSKKTRKH